MRLAMLGLGRMGFNMMTRLLKGGHALVAFDRSPGPRERAEAEGAESAATLEEVANKLIAPRICWSMLPAGDVTANFIHSLAAFLQPGDIIIDGGNSYYQDSIHTGDTLRQKGIHFVDVGTSGGVWGLTEGYSLMIGGDDAVVDSLRPIFETLAPAPDQGWGHVGPLGAGHFTKMVHNGIEYGLMQAYAEGFALLGSKTEFHLDLHQIAEVWRTGSVVRSWLLDLTARALADNPTLEGIAPYVADSGEGRWTVLEAIEQKVPLPVIAMALMTRYRSQEESPFAEKLLAVMREQFGGHAVKHEE